MRKANTHLLTHADKLQFATSETVSAFAAVSATDDQRLYVEFNRRRWEQPRDEGFVPCVGHFDTAEMAVEDSAARTVLQNRLLKARQKRSETTAKEQNRKREVQGLINLRDAYAKQDGLGDPDEVMDVSMPSVSCQQFNRSAEAHLPKNLLESSRELLMLECSSACLEAEESLLVDCLGASVAAGLTDSAAPHSFQPASFTIPTSCDFCGGTIWGIAKQGGLFCRPCGFTVHAKCELKVEPTCGAPHDKKRSQQQQQESAMGQTAQRSSTGSNDVVAGGSSSAAMTGPQATMIYGFDATSPFELSVAGEYALRTKRGSS